MPDTKPSFTRALFGGEIREEFLFPYPPSLEVTNPDEARTVRRLIAALDNRLGGLIDSAKFDEEETIGDDVVTALAAEGFLGITIPKAYGGLELSAAGYARVFEAAAATDASIGVFIGVHCGLGAKAIVLYGNEAQKAKWLPKLASGEVRAAYGLTEPDIGSDAQHVKTTATLTDDGKFWRLNGQKIWIGNGHRAGVIATFAQTAIDRDGETIMRPTAFLIEPPTPGFRVVETVHKMGIRGSTQAQLEYKDLLIPRENILGEVGKGFQVAVHVLNGGRLTLAAGCTGGAKRLLSEMTRYAEQRIQFGSPLADFEITQRKLSTLAANIYASDSMLGVLGRFATEDDVDWSLEAAIAKVFASEMIWHAADEMVQVAGGRGFVRPYPYERYLRDSRINRIFEGANEILRLFIALNGIQQQSEHLKELSSALREPMRNFGLLSEYAATRVKQVLNTPAALESELHPRLEVHKKYLARHVAELSTAAQRAIVKHKKELIHRQLVVERLANMAIEVVARACVIARTNALIARDGMAATEPTLALCELFCVESGRRFRDARNALDDREDEVDDARRAAASAVRHFKGYFVDDAILTPGNG